MSLKNLSVEELREASVDLDHQIRALRGRRLEIAREIESRFPEAEPQERPAQVAAPAFVESESEVASPTDPPRRKRWRR